MGYWFYCGSCTRDHGYAGSGAAMIQHRRLGPTFPFRPQSRAQPSSSLLLHDPACLDFASMYVGRWRWWTKLSFRFELFFFFFGLNYCVGICKYYFCLLITLNHKLNLTVFLFSWLHWHHCWYIFGVEIWKLGIQQQKCYTYQASCVKIRHLIRTWSFIQSGSPCIELHKKSKKSQWIWPR